MKYKIIARIRDGHKTMGYQLLCEDGSKKNIALDQVLQAAAHGLITNATYNKHTKSISGTGNTDLRKLDTIQYSDLVKGAATNKPSNCDMDNRDTGDNNNEKLREYIKSRYTTGVNDFTSVDQFEKAYVNMIRAEIHNLMKKYGVNVEIVEENKYGYYENPPYKLNVGIAFRICQYNQSKNTNNGKGFSALLFSVRSKYVNTKGTQSGPHLIFSLKLVNASVSYETYANSSDSWDLYRVDLIFDDDISILKYIKSQKKNFYGYTKTVYSLDEEMFLDNLVSIAKETDKFIRKNRDMLNELASEEDKDIPYELIDECKKDKLYNFSNGKSSVDKARKLEAQGYTVVIQNQSGKRMKMTSDEFDKFRYRLLGDSGRYSSNNFDAVYEYIDTGNKIFYCKLGRVINVDFWC